MPHAVKLGKFICSGFAEKLADVKDVLQIRGEGLMIGIELAHPCGDLVKLALEQGLLINVTAENVIRLLPPLVMQEAEAQQLIDILSALIVHFVQQSTGTRARA